MRKWVKIFFPLFIVGLCINAQVPVNPIGLTPSKLKWNQINSERFRIIFPVGMDTAGLRVANILDYLWEENNSVGELNKKVSIVLHNQTIRPNGLVTPGPFRSEFYTRSPQFNCTSDWIDLLAIHEYQHVKQFANADRGITKVARKLLGSWTWGGFAATAIPRWFWEGDATVQETRFSKSGRGRLPAFHMRYNALLENNNIPNYEKAGARSFKEFIPNWYPLGYYMNLYARNKYGENIWAEVVEEAVRYKGLFYPFSNSLKRKTGMSTKALYNETIKELSTAKNYKKATVRISNESLLSANPKIYTHYTNPHFISDSSYISIKSGFDHIPEIVKLSKSQTESRYTAIGFMPENPYNSISYSNGILCWSENSLDPRWLYKNYSIIKTYDTKTRLKTQLTKKTKYFSPELNHSGTKIVTVEANENNQYKLVILNSKDGAFLNEYPNPQNFTLIYPCWSEDDQNLYTVVQTDEKHFLATYDLSGNLTPLTPALPSQISHPYAHGNYLFYSAAYQESNQIYALDLVQNQIFQITNSSLGAFMPSTSPDGLQLIYSEYSALGHKAVKIKLDPVSWIIFNPETYQSELFGSEQISDRETILDKIPNKNFEISKFKKSTKLINFHSLLPTISHPLYNVSLLSDNSFGTLRGELGASYNTNEKQFSWFGEFTFAGWYPEISVSGLHRNRAASSFEFIVPNDTTLRTNFYVEEWSENVAGLSVALPLRFQAGQVFHSLRLKAGAQYIQTDIVGNKDLESNNRDTFRIAPQSAFMFEALERPLLANQSFSTLEFSFDWRSVRNRARRHLNPRAGIVTSLNYRQTLGASDIESKFFSALGNVYLPGIKPTHSLWLQLGYRNQSIFDYYRFPDRFIYPRGYGANLSDEYSRISLNYSLPILYPDLAIGSLLFIQRVKLNAFFDASLLKIGFPFDTQQHLNSVGVDLTFDIRALRLLDMDFGIRYSYLLNPNYSPNGSLHQFDFLVLSISG